MGKEATIADIEKAFNAWSEQHVIGGLSGLCRKIFYAGWEAKEAFDERTAVASNNVINPTAPK